MKIFVTGATGFIGRHLLRSLAPEGHEVTAFLGPGATPEAIADTGAATFDHFGEIAALLEHFQTHAYDGVVHLATCYVAEHSAADLDRLVDANLRFGLHILEAATQGKVPWLINIGTIWQNYDQQDYNPTNLYAATKQAFEDLIKFYDETTETRFATIKFCDTYGPGDTRRKLFALWQEAAASGATLAMSPGEQLVDIVHVRDVVSALRRLIDILQDPGQLTALDTLNFRVGSGNPLPLRELAAIFAAATGRALNIEWGGRPYRRREVMTPWQGGRTVPGWAPQVTLAEGIRELYR